MFLYALVACVLLPFAREQKITSLPSPSISGAEISCKREMHRWLLCHQALNEISNHMQTPNNQFSKGVRNRIRNSRQDVTISHAG